MDRRESTIFDYPAVGESEYVPDNDFGFDFPDDLSIQSDVIFSSVVTASSTSSSSSSPVKEELDGEKKLIKSKTFRKRGSKFMRKLAASYPPKLALRPKATTIGVRTLLPNMSRRTRDTALYTFPSFDRCDSLLFFPSTLARHMNTGDIPSISKLFETHFDKHCTIDSFSRTDPSKPQPGITAHRMTQKMAVLEQLQPDCITCMRSTQVDGNQIKAVLYKKYTNVPSITEAVVNRAKNSYFSTCFQDSWQQHLRRKLQQQGHSAADLEYYLSLIDKKCDVLVYSRIDMILTIDDRTKKVKHFSVVVTTTSMEEVKYTAHDCTADV